jgi:hypothetical protein
MCSGIERKNKERKAGNVLEKISSVLSRHPSSGSLKDVLIVVRRIPEDVLFVSAAAGS